MITRLQKEAISIADSGKTNARRVTAALRRRFAGKSMPDFLGLQLGVVRLVEDDLDQLIKADNLHVHELVGSRLQLKERDALYGDVFGSLSGIRGVVAGTYGDDARVELFGDVSALPQDPLELHRLGVRVHAQLVDEDFELPEVRLAGAAPLDRKAVAAGLKRRLDRLGRALADLSLERKDADATLFDKNEGIEGFRRTVRYAAGCLASLYGLAGFDDLAAKIRPQRRAPRRGGPAGGPDDGGGESVSAEAPETSGEAESPQPSAEGSESAEPAGGDDGAAPVEATGPIGIVR